MTLPPYFISADWGTTRLRLRLVDSRTLDVVAGPAFGDGIRSVNDALSTRSTDREDFFRTYLSTQIQNLAGGHRAGLVVLTGMASANIGMRELPYGKLPLTTEGRGVVSRLLPGVGTPDILLTSGICTDNDVMRGEETQALGLLDRMPEEGVLLLPGTHSKHLRVAGGAITGLRTYLTGELFDLLSTHSLLSGSVKAIPWNASLRPPFLAGLERGRHPLAAELFAIRAATLLRDVPAEEQYYFLSGLLIGHELSALTPPSRVYLAAAGPLLELYEIALRTLFPDLPVTVFGRDALIRALLFGQHKVVLAYGK